MTRFLLRMKKIAPPLFALSVWAALCLQPELKPCFAFTDSSPVPLPFNDTSVVPVPQYKASRQERTFFRKETARDRMALRMQALRGFREEKHQRLRAIRKQGPVSDIGITYEDMQACYQIGSDFLEYYAFPRDVVMDMGFEDPYLTTSQRWTVPAGLDWKPVTRKIVDPEATPYSNMAPEATHCLYFPSSSAETEAYSYYQLDEDGLYYLCRQVERFNYSDEDDYEVLSLPLDVDTDFQSGTGEEEDWTADTDTTWYSDTDYGVEAWYYWSEAFGILETPDDGPVEVIKIAFQWIWAEYEVGSDEPIDEANGTEIYFYSRDGHQLAVSLDSLGVETTGLVRPDRIYYQKVRKPGSSVSGETAAASPGFHFFPNPANGTVRFSSPVTFELFDVLGRRVLSEVNAVQADLSKLPRGIYFIRPQKGPTQKLLIQR